MDDKLNLTLDELIKKERQTKKKGKPQKKFGDRGQKPKQGQSKQQKMRQRTGVVNAPSAREKAQQLRKQKVGRFGETRDRQEPFRSGKVITIRSREGRSDRDNWRKRESSDDNRKPRLSNKLRVSNLNNSISNEDLNVLFRNIGPLKE